MTRLHYYVLKRVMAALTVFSFVVIAAPAFADQTGAGSWEPLGPYITSSASTTSESITDSAKTIAAALIESSSTTAAAMDRATESGKQFQAYIVLAVLIGVFALIATYKA